MAYADHGADHGEFRSERPRLGLVKGRGGEKLRGHEAFLKALEKSNTEVEVVLMTDDPISGVIAHSDKFTITVRQYLPGTQTENGHEWVIFKHAISHLRAKSPRPQKEE
jgi:sRNA-binding regulator protein Hfq